MPQAWARKDVRLALLVANQEGWVRDPRLRYVVSGDLKPMARKLKRLGFTVHATLANQGPDAIRRAWKQVLKRLQQAPQVTTFFFYYSGHADRRYFHAGPRGKKPLSYRELATFLSRVHVRRRFVLLDACFSGELLRQFGSVERYRTLMQKGNLFGKGIERKLSFTDLRKHFPSQGEKVRGLQILSSSRFLSYESDQRRSSVFTYHFLRGLDGRADLDRDGKISFNELFLYVKPRVSAETGQTPQQWLFRVGGETYGFAPVYNSTLHIDASLRGRLRVRVNSFVWRWHKRDPKAMRLAVSTGYGTVVWRRGQRCHRQRLYFPPGKAVLLRRSRWLPVNCRRVGLLQKGRDITLLPLESAIERSLHGWTFEAQAGLFGTSGWLDIDGDLGGVGWFGVRRRFFGVLLGVGGSQSLFPASGISRHMLLALRVEGGYHGRWGKVDLFAGAFAQIGMLLQDITSARPLLVSLALQGGLSVVLGYWFSPRFALFVATDFGVVPRLSPQASAAYLAYGLRVGVRFSLAGGTLDAS